jgi:hypothetical protein
LLVKRIFLLLNAAFAMTILEFNSRVQSATAVVLKTLHRSVKMLNLKDVSNEIKKKKKAEIVETHTKLCAYL